MMISETRKKSEVRYKIIQKNRAVWDRKCKEIDTYIYNRQCEAFSILNTVTSDPRNYNTIQLI